MYLKLIASRVGFIVKCLFNYVLSVKCIYQKFETYNELKFNYAL